MFVVKFGFKIWNHSINDVTHLEKGGSAKSLFSKMGDKGEGGVTNLKKWVTSFIDGPLYLKPNWEYVQIRSYTILIELYNTMCPMFFSHTFSGLFLRKKKFSWKWHSVFFCNHNECNFSCNFVSCADDILKWKLCLYVFSRNQNFKTETERRPALCNIYCKQ